MISFLLFFSWFSVTFTFAIISKYTNFGFCTRNKHFQSKRLFRNSCKGGGLVLLLGRGYPFLTRFPRGVWIFCKGAKGGGVTIFYILKKERKTRTISRCSFHAIPSTNSHDCPLLPWKASVDLVGGGTHASVDLVGGGYPFLTETQRGRYQNFAETPRGYPFFTNTFPEIYQPPCRPNKNFWTVPKMKHKFYIFQK